MRTEGVLKCKYSKTYELLQIHVSRGGVSEMQVFQDLNSEPLKIHLSQEKEEVLVTHLLEACKLSIWLIGHSHVFSGVRHIIMYYTCLKFGGVLEKHLEGRNIRNEFTHILALWGKRRHSRCTYPQFSGHQQCLKKQDNTFTNNTTTSDFKCYLLRFVHLHFYEQYHNKWFQILSSSLCPFALI